MVFMFYAIKGTIEDKGLFSSWGTEQNFIHRSFVMILDLILPSEPTDGAIYHIGNKRLHVT